ncbi:MAG TPA: Ig-like domain-containing protein, partial [Armatimonadota bacterium]|nr:Ig-like domain-containing protein [Armatimonadota bacterium]
MKKFVRGLYGRVMGILLVALMLVPSTLSLPTIAQAAGGGRQNIILLPLHTADDDAPFDLAGRISRELQVMLGGQVGVEVNELTRNSLLLTRESKTMEETKFAELMASYDRASDPKLRMDARVAASGVLVEGLGVDAVVFGVLDQYEFTARPDPRRAYIHLTAVKVTKEANAPAYASPFEVIGKSRVLPDNGGSQLSHDAEAIANIARNLAAQLTGGKQVTTSDPVRPPKAPKVGKQPVAPDEDEVEKPRGKFNIVYGILAIGVLAALAGGGGGGGGGAVPPPPAVPGLAFAAPTAAGVEFQLVKPEKFDQLISFRIQRADRGVAGTRAAGARAATDVVATVPKAQLVQHNNFIYFSDGPLSTHPPTIGYLYEYTLVAVYSDGSTETFTVVNLSNRNTTTVGPGVPPPVQSVSARVITGSIVEISWELGSTLPAFVTGFVIERKLANEPPSAWMVDGAVAPASARSAQRTVPAAGEYMYRVYAKSTSGFIHPTQVTGSVTVITGKPQGPASVTVTEVPRPDARGSVGLRVEWPVPTDTFVDGYELYRVRQTKSSFASSITGGARKLPPAPDDRRSPGRQGGRGSVRDPRQMGSRADGWELLKKITTRQDTSYQDNDVTDRMGYTYRVVALAGAALAQPFKADPVESSQFWVDLDPGDVTTLDVANTRGNVNLAWQAPTKNADGLTELLDGQAFEIWRSASLAAGTTTVTRAVLEEKFQKIKTVAWSINNTYRDVEAPLRQAVMYAIVPVDAANQYAPGDYQVKGLTPLPDIADVTIAPAELTVTLGAPVEMLTITAVGTDSLPVPNVVLVASCQTGLLSKSADGVGAANSQQLTTGADGKAVVYWKSQIVGEDYITVNVMFDGKAAGISSQTHIIINPAIAESLALTLADEEVVAVDAVAPHTSLDPTKKAQTTAKVKLTDNKGVPVPNKKIIFACTDPNVLFLDATGLATNFAITDQNGEATLTVRAGYKVSTVTVVAFFGTLMKEATLRIGPGQPAKMRMVVQNPLLPARATASTGGTVKVVDKNDNVAPNTAVLLTTSHGTISPIVGATDANGELAFTLTAAPLPAGVLQQNVTVTAGIFSVDPPLMATPVDLSGNAVQVRFVALVPNRIELTSNVATLVADTGSQAVITAKVYDVFGQLVDDGTEVEFTVVGGGVFQGLQALGLGRLR